MNENEMEKTGLREIERQKMNLEEGDEMEIQEIEGKQRKRKGREIERSREEKRRMRERMIKREREGGISGEVERKREGKKESEEEETCEREERVV